MDRVSIGNARLYDMEADLGMDPNGTDYLLAVSVLFITYCVSWTRSAFRSSPFDADKCSSLKHPPMPS